MSGAHELTQATLAVALEELTQGAGEQGGNNLGPWVEKYMGKAGLPWCVGFATWCYREACQRLGIAPVLKERWSSSRLAAEANRHGLLIERAGEGLVLPGHFFIVRGGPTGFKHTGLVREVHWDAMGRLASITTVEGNVRPAGGGQLDRVLSRTRQRGLVFVAY